MFASLRKIFFSSPPDPILEALEKITYLNMISPDERRILARVLFQKEYSEDEEIYPEKSPATAMYFIVKGSVGLFKSGENQMADRLKYLAKSACFGYSALFNPGFRQTGAKTLEKSTLLILLRSDFEKLTISNPGFALKVLTAVGNQILSDFADLQAEYQTLTNKLTRANIIV
jgi:CRP-like cAMP-binding protein